MGSSAMCARWCLRFYYVGCWEPTNIEIDYQGLWSGFDLCSEMRAWRSGKMECLENNWDTSNSSLCLRPPDELNITEAPSMLPFRPSNPASIEFDQILGPRIVRVPHPTSSVPTDEDVPPNHSSIYHERSSSTRIHTMKPHKIVDVSIDTRAL